MGSKADYWKERANELSADVARLEAENKKLRSEQVTVHVNRQVEHAEAAIDLFCHKIPALSTTTVRFGFKDTGVEFIVQEPWTVYSPVPADWKMQ